ncbi:MAG: hypothetical protein ACYC08_05740 [Armatimonadota bacterium]
MSAKLAMAGTTSGMESLNRAIESLNESMKKLPAALEPAFSAFGELQSALQTCLTSMSWSLEGIKKSVAEFANPFALPTVQLPGAVQGPKETSTTDGGQGSESAPDGDTTGGEQGSGSTSDDGQRPKPTTATHEPTRPYSAPTQQEILEAQAEKVGKDFMEAVKAAILGKGKWEDVWKVIPGGIKDTRRMLGDAITGPDFNEWTKTLQERAMPDVDKLLNSTLDWAKGKGKFKGVEDAVNGLVGTIKNSLKDLGKQELNRFVDNFFKAALSGKDAFKNFGKDVSALFKNIGDIASSSIGSGIIQGFGAMGLLSKDKTKRKKSIFGGLLGGIGAALIPGLNLSAMQGLLYGSAGGQMLFDNPLNDSMAVRMGQSISPTLSRSDADLVRLVGRGVLANIPTSAGALAGGNTVNHYHNIQVSTNIEKVTSIQDLERLSETQAWIISKRLKLVRNGA